MGTYTIKNPLVFIFMKNLIIILFLFLQNVGKGVLGTLQLGIWMAPLPKGGSRGLVVKVLDSKFEGCARFVFEA